MKIKVRINREDNADYFGVNLDSIIDIQFEEYLIGVVATEIGNSNLEACKAQAVASRTYAISRNVLIGQPISDTGNVMAYRAIRTDKNKYPNAYQAIQSTKGQILIYDHTPIRAVYSANNGGQTTSSEERWGSTFPYLISQADPWDAADGHSKKGHGVGLSQLGAIWAGSHGQNYKDILNFYYPNTILVNNYGQEDKTMNVLLNDVAINIIVMAKQHLGHPYVYAGAGQLCTPTNRKAKINSSYPNIINKCQVLNHTGASTCDGCKYNGCRFFDCRGFTYWILKQNNITISAVGATTQYNTASSWSKRGKVEEMPNVVCCVFKYKEESKTMAHTGLHIGNGVIIHCTGSKAGEVQYDAVGGQGWTHFAIPKELYTDDELTNAEKLNILAGLKKGATGLNVSELQQKLNELGYVCGIDGRYGNDTANAVKQFQRAYNLTVDGIAGAITRTLILNLTKNITASIGQTTMPTEQITIPTSTFDEPIVITPIINSNKVNITLDKDLAQALYNELRKLYN